MMSLSSSSGISCVGDVAWGTHFCQFYESRDDLVDSLVPYFKAGLDQNEQCLWVTAEPLRSADARSALANVVPDLAQREKNGQIEIIDHDEWYTRKGVLDTPTVLRGWVETQEQALSRGFNGLRLTGNTHWLEQKNWVPFEQYESLVTNTFKPHRIIALCSYCLDKTHSKGVLDVVRNHQFAVIRRNGEWEMIESAALKSTKHQLHELNRELESRVVQRTADLNAMLRVRDEFLSIASHELKTPLAALKLQIDSTLRAQSKGTLSPEEVNQRLRKAEVQCRRLDTLITNLLDISRSTTGQADVQLESVDLSEVVKEVVERFAEQAAEKGCTLSLSAALPVVGQWNRMKLEQVASNLVGNAIKYAPGAPIEVNVSRSEHSSSLSVSDRGPGIEEKDQQKIFERFTQLEGGKNSGGFGLGLWIVREIVQQFSGTVSVWSEPGHGTRFSVQLPRVA